MEAELLRQERHRMHGRLLLRAAVILLLAVLMTTCGSLLFSILLPFVAAYLLAALLNIPIHWFERRFGVGRSAGSVLLSILLVSLVGVLLWRGVGQIVQEIERLLAVWDTLELDVLESLQEAAVRLARLFGQNDPAALEALCVKVEQAVLWVIRFLAERANQWSLPAAERAGDVIVSIVNIVISTTVFLLATFYFMRDGSGVFEQLKKHLPLAVTEKCAIVRNAAGRAFGGYFRAEFLLSAGAGVITGVSLMIYGQSFAILLGVIVCIVDFIPILGSGVVLMPWAVVLLLSGDLNRAIFLVILCAALFLLRRLLEPKVVGNQTGLPTLLSLLCIYVGMVWGGILGMVFVPALCLMVIEMKRAGFFDGTIEDLKLLFRELGEILHGT